MIIIPGFVISAVTFPGVIVHEAAHMLFCRWRKIAVLDVCFFRLGNPAGYVIHEEITNFTSAFLVSVGPFIVNSLLCIVVCFPAYLPMHVFGVRHPLSLFLMWLGLSIGMHAFPSTGDAMGLFQYAKKAAKSFNPLAIISFPLIVLIVVGNVLSVVWVDLAYGIALGIGLPSLLL